MSESEPFNDIQESKFSLVHLKHIQRWLDETHFCKSYVAIKLPSRHFPTRFHFWARTSLRNPDVQYVNVAEPKMKCIIPATQRRSSNFSLRIHKSCQEKNFHINAVDIDLENLLASRNL